MMAIDEKNKGEELQYRIDKEEGNISALFSGKIDKCEYLIGEQILPQKLSKLNLHIPCFEEHLKHKQK